MVTRHDLTDVAWTRLEPLLPAQKPNTGPTANPHRPIVNGILWLKRSGAPWRDIPPCYGKCSTIASRFYRWCKQGIWQRIWQSLQQLADAQERIDWQTHFVDATIVRAHQHAAGARDTTPEAQALGRSQAGFSTKIHSRAEGGGKPITFVLSVGQRHEALVFEQL